MANDSEKVLDVTGLPHGTKHKAVLDTFDQLKEGGSFILHNDHDPKPLYYQFVITRKDTFTWDYLKNEPNLVEVRIAKKALHKPEEEKAVDNENVLDGICLDPSVKFQTIIKTFNDLKPGESFILKNDHDPKPLYYHLSGEYSDTFTWNYLQEGPEIFKVRIAKKSASRSEKVGLEAEERVLDGIAIAPSVKFQTIMKTFNDLKEGEHFVLHNDHDPKPLYYQLSSTHGDIFIWEYLKQGPDAFDIRIGKRVLSGHKEADKPKDAESKEFHDHILFAEDTPETARTIVAKDYRKAEVFRRHGMDYAWKGDRSIPEMCAEAGVLESIFRQELSDAEQDYSEVIPSRDYYYWNMAFLADYVLQTHHQYVKDNADRISDIAEEVGRVHGKEHPYLQELAEKVRPMITDFMVHMSKEENVLFPAIKYMLDLKKKGEKQAGPGGDIARGIRKMEEEHDETRVFLQCFRKITNGYKLSADACEAHTQLYKDLQLFENDCYLHVHLENNILFPKTIILEKIISGR